MFQSFFQIPISVCHPLSPDSEGIRVDDDGIGLRPQLVPKFFQTLISVCHTLSPDSEGDMVDDDRLGFWPNSFPGATGDDRHEDWEAGGRASR